MARDHPLVDQDRWRILDRSRLAAGFSQRWRHKL